MEKDTNSETQVSLGERFIKAVMLGEEEEVLKLLEIQNGGRKINQKTINSASDSNGNFD